MTKIKMIAIAALVIGSSSSAFSQVSATANTQATIVAPLTIVNVTELNFGNVAVSAVLGTVDLTASATPTRTPSGGVTLSPANPGTVTAASFTVGGTANYTYAITLPAGATTITNGGNNMTVDGWVSSPTPTGTIGVGGTQTLYVGATLNVAGSQAPGVYNSAVDFSVSVIYN